MKGNYSFAFYRFLTHPTSFSGFLFCSTSPVTHTGFSIHFLQFAVYSIYYVRNYVFLGGKPFYLYICSSFLHEQTKKIQKNALLTHSQKINKKTNMDLKSYFVIFNSKSTNDARDPSPSKIRLTSSSVVTILTLSVGGVKK